MLADEPHICNDSAPMRSKNLIRRWSGMRQGGRRGYVYTEIHRLGKLSVNHSSN